MEGLSKYDIQTYSLYQIQYLRLDCTQKVTTGNSNMLLQVAKLPTISLQLMKSRHQAFYLQWLQISVVQILVQILHYKGVESTLNLHCRSVAALLSVKGPVLFAAQKTEV